MINIEKTKTIEPSEVKLEELKLLTVLRELGYGNATVTVRNSRPVMVKCAVKDIKLD